MLRALQLAIILCALIVHSTELDIDHKGETIGATTLVSTDPSLSVSLFEELNQIIPNQKHQLLDAEPSERASNKKKSKVGHALT